jgi:hypothetical protein
MMYRELVLKSTSPDSARTEILYNVAAARVDKIGLLKIAVERSLILEDNEGKKYLKKLSKTLNDLRKSGKIQFFATEEDFSGASTKADFLKNKYPTIFGSTSLKDEKYLLFFLKL